MKVYIITNQEDPDNYMLCVVARSPGVAKSLAMKEELFTFSDYIDLRATECKNGNKEGLASEKVLDETEGLSRGFYDVLLYADCPACGAKEVTLYYKKNFYCDRCESDEKRIE